MERLPSGTYNTSESVDSPDGILPPQPPCPSGETIACGQAELTQDSGAPLQDEGTLNPSESAVHDLPFVLGTSLEPKVNSLQAFQDTPGTITRGPDRRADTCPGNPPARATFVDAAVQCSPTDHFSYHGRSSRCATQSGVDSVESRMGGTIRTPSECSVPPKESTRRRPFEQDGRNGIMPSNPNEPVRLPPASFLITRCDRDDPRRILSLLKKDAGRGAKCLWQYDEGECGFSSQIDLVKRHIKRVHYRLR